MERRFWVVIIGGRVVILIIIELQKTHFIKDISYSKKIILFGSDDLCNKHDSQ